MGEMLLGSSADAYVLHQLSLTKSEEVISLRGDNGQNIAGFFFWGTPNDPGQVIVQYDGRVTLSFSNPDRKKNISLPAPLDQQGKTRAAVSIAPLVLGGLTNEIITGGDDGILRVICMVTKRVSFSMAVCAPALETDHPDRLGSAVTCLGSNHKNGLCVAAGTANGDIFICDWHSKSRELAKRQSLKIPAEENRTGTHAGRPPSVTSIAFCPFYSDILAVSTSSGSLYVWDLSTSSLRSIFTQLHNSSCNALAWSPLNRHALVTGGSDGYIRLLMINSNKEINTHCIEEAITAQSFNSEGRVLASGTEKGNIFVHDLKNFNLLHKMSCHKPAPVRCLQFYLGKQFEDAKDNAANEKAAAKSMRTSRSSVSSVQSRSSAQSRRRPDPNTVNGNRSSAFSNSSALADDRLATAAANIYASKHGPSSHSRGGIELFTPAKPRSTEISSAAMAADGLSTASSGSNGPDSKAHLSSMSERPSPAKPNIGVVDRIAERVLQSTMHSPRAAKPVSPYLEKQREGIALETRKFDKSVHSEVDISSGASQNRNSASTGGNHGYDDLDKREKKDASLQRESELEQTAMNSRNMEYIERLIQDYRNESRQDMRNMQLEMMRQFHLQMEDIQNCLGRFTEKFADIVDDNNRLRAENERLRNLF